MVSPFIHSFIVAFVNGYVMIKAGLRESKTLEGFCNLDEPIKYIYSCIFKYSFNPFIFCSSLILFNEFLQIKENYTYTDTKMTSLLPCAQLLDILYPFNSSCNVVMDKMYYLKLLNFFDSGFSSQ